MPIASHWHTGSPLSPKSETTFIGSLISKINFIPGQQYRWLLTVFKWIWPVLTIWDINRQQKCSEWSAKGTVFTENLNTDAESKRASQCYCECPSLSSTISDANTSQRMMLLCLNGIDSGMNLFRQYRPLPSQCHW